MLLCVDIGNTNIVIGLYDNNDTLIKKFRLKSSFERTADEYGVIIRNMLEYSGYQSKDIQGIIVSSVVPLLDTIFEKLSIDYFNITPIFVAPGLKSGIKIKIDNPKQLGADLLVGAVGAVSKYQSPIIIIDMGTAITLSVVNENKEFIGGIIYPGIKTAFNSLIKRTSRLEEAKFKNIDNIIGKDTVSCIQSGMIYGTSSMIDGIIRKTKKEIPNARVVLTGGESKMILGYLEEEVIYDDDLLLDGLRILFYKNVGIE